ncbi:STAS/SEC14 domain-containing protein [Loktanella sp. DJP18]|uniref:STAS/SEC14 domain-containing protein n=1 Tax=Loktanella sp. DJP18 TaxID=3409788 RepID=UPI003BB593B0
MTTIHGVVPIPTDHDHVYAFDVTGDLDATGMGEMGEMLNHAFDQHPGKVNVLLHFRHFETSDAGVGTTLSAMKAQLRSLTHVGRYAVVGAPQAAANMIAFFNHIIPVDARTFAADDEQAAWDFVNVAENSAKS